MLAVPPSKIERIIGRVVVVGPDDDGEAHSEAVKPAWWPKPGETVKRFTPAQASVAASASGWRTEQTLRQLIRELDAGLHADASDECWVLFRELAEKIAAHDPSV